MDEGSRAATGAATSMHGSDLKRPPSSIDQPQRPLSTDMSRVCNQGVTATGYGDAVRPDLPGEQRRGPGARDSHQAATPVSAGRTFPDNRRALDVVRPRAL